MDRIKTILDLKNNFEPLFGDLVEISLFRVEDITDKYIGWLNNPEVTKYSNQRFQHHSAVSCQQYLGSFQGTPNLFLKIRRRSDKRMVGTMTAYVSLPHRTADIGIMVGDQTAWGKGIGQDAWATLMKWLLSHEAIRKVTAGTMCCNHAMVKIMEHSGMVLEAIRPKQELFSGQPIDIVYYGMFGVE